jgi:hypothetical protein
VAGVAQRALGLELVVDPEGAGFHHHARAHARRRDGGDGLFERRRLGQAGDDGRHLEGEVLGVGGDLDPGFRHGAAARRVDVVPDHAPAVGHKVLGESAAHDAEADDADGPLALRHSQTSVPM